MLTQIGEDLIFETDLQLKNQVSMAAKYYVVKKPQTNDHHAVHKEGCPFMPDYNKSIYLGKFSSEKNAESAGRKYFAKTKGCLFCSTRNKHYNPESFQFKMTKKETNAVRTDFQMLQSMMCSLN
jgi:hypothetical protein